MEKCPLVILAGPTAVGKTKLSISLAKAIGGEIISCDSMQVYRGMDIGSAKITKEEMAGVEHHLIDVLSPEESFNVATFVSLAKDAIAKVRANGHIPIACGGTGFYIQALLYDASFSDEAEDDGTLRRTLEEKAKNGGANELYERLRTVDPESAAAIHSNNTKRVIRALEYFELHGEPISAHNRKQHAKESPYDFTYFVLNDKRERLYANIDARVDQMMASGLYEEVKSFYDAGYTKDMVSMQGLGYKELFDVFEGNCKLEEAIEHIKRDTRHFAKRQLTWFRSKPEVLWINKDDFSYDEEKMLAYMIDQIGE